MKNLARRITGGVLAASALVAGVASGGGASAAIYAGGGVWGANWPANVTCRYLNAYGTLRTEVPPPTAYAYNRISGGGNDRQTVRYRLFFVNATTGATITSTGWSGWATAWDNKPAQWSGTSMQSFTYTSHIRVDTRIEFYNYSTGAFEGWTAHKADAYYFFKGYPTYGVGPLSSCFLQ